MRTRTVTSGVLAAIVFTTAAGTFTASSSAATGRPPSETSGRPQVVTVSQYLTGRAALQKAAADRGTQVELGKRIPRRTVEALLARQRRARQPLRPDSEAVARANALETGATYGTDSRLLADGDDITVQECRERADLSSRPEGWIKNHYSYCQMGRLNYWQFQCRLVFCWPVGSLSARVTNMGYTYNGLREADWTVHIDQISSSGMSNGGRLTVSLDCEASETERGCASFDPSTTKTVPQWRAIPQAGILFSSPSDPPSAANGEQLTFGTFRFRYTLRTRITQRVQGPETGVRFDTAWYLPRKYGSIFNRVTPYLSYSISDPEVNETARHIRDAQQAPEQTDPRVDGKHIPGASAEDPLRRLFYDRLRVDRNTRAAIDVCRTVSPDYSSEGKDCDEYPFKTTYEGAALDQYDSSTPYGNFSARALDSDDNQTAGRRLGTWYGRDRILDGDEFYVRIND